MVYELEKQPKNDDFINCENIEAHFKAVNLDNKYRSSDSKKEQRSKNALKEVEKVLEYLPEKLSITISQWQNSGTLINYFWIKLKYEKFKYLPSSISIFADDLGFKVIIEADFYKGEKKEGISKYEYFEKHNKYLYQIQKDQKNLKDMMYLIKKGKDILGKNPVSNITKDLKNVISNKYDTLQAGYFKTYADLQKECNTTLDKVPLKYLLNWIYECINILVPYYNKCIEENNNVGKLGEAPTEDEHIPIQDLKNINFNEDFKIENLHYEDKDLLQKQISKALKNGKHIILTGPPGTGKSKLAKEICNHYKANYKMTTALADWSTYDTIGGYSSNKDGSLYFQPGIFLSCFKDSNTNKKNEWLIIDEMNRADIDKAFGVFFSALTGDSVDLSFKGNNNKNIKIFNEKDKSETNLENEYIISKDFRLIGTINSFDKTSLFEMSYAFMRRFAFIPVTVPKNINSELIEKYLTIWNISKEDWLLNGLSELWKIINKYRKIGPAILEDIARYVESEEDFSSAITLYVLPQFEGLDEEDFQRFIKDILNINIIKDKSIIISFLEDFFGYIYKE